MLDGAGRVMVVDDDEDWRDLVVQFLDESGFDATGFANGRDALAALRRRDDPPAVILLDLEMPVMTGWEFRRELLRDPGLAAIPVVVASSADLRSIDADAYLEKPFEGGELCRVLGGLCAAASAGLI
jgi:CheY-like chemotaxis protein